MRDRKYLNDANAADLWLASAQKPDYTESPHSRFEVIFRQMTIRVALILEYMPRQQLRKCNKQFMKKTLGYVLASVSDLALAALRFLFHYSQFRYKFRRYFTVPAKVHLAQ